MVTELRIAGRAIGAGHPCFVIAEAGVNHNGDVNLACRLVEVAADAGADAVKFQTFTADALVTADAPKADYQRLTTAAAESQFEMLRGLELSRDAHCAVLDRCHARGICFLSTPFDEASADFLESLDVPAFKIASGDLTDLPLLAHVARTRRPLIVSTGMASLDDVRAAVGVVRGAGNEAMALLHCVSNYPAAACDVNLRAMRTMADAFQVPVGYSDHTLGNEVALAAVALGACIVEKHFTLSRSLPGPDHQASIEPEDLARLVREIRTVEAALGHGRKEPAEAEVSTAAAARKSLVAASDIPAGTVLTEQLIAIKRPGTGLPPSRRAALIGRRTRVPISRGALLGMDMLI